MVALSNSTVATEPAAPSERDWQLYEAVAVLGISSRSAAHLFGISQTRVLQVRQRMEEWIGRFVPRSGDSLSPRERLFVAADLADRRSQMLFSEAMNAWRASQDAARERCTASERHVGPSQGDPRCLAMAMRTNMHMLQVAGLAQRQLARLEKEAAEAQAEGPTAAAVAAASDPSNTEANPLVGDCSPATTEQAAPVVEPLAADGVSASEQATCDEQESRRRAFLAAVEAETAPVHPPRTDVHGMLLEEGDDAAWTPETEDAAAAEDGVATPAPTRRPLNRQERKARERLLKRKLQKAK
jgi:hypothetical protein